MKKLDIGRVLIGELQRDPEDNLIKIEVSGLILRIIGKPIDGITFSEMGVMVDLARKINRAISNKENHVLLETVEHAALVARLKAFRYAVVEPVIYDWIKEIDALPDVKITVDEGKS